MIVEASQRLRELYSAEEHFREHQKVLQDLQRIEQELEELEAPLIRLVAVSETAGSRLAPVDADSVVERLALLASRLKAASARFASENGVSVDIKSIVDSATIALGDANQAWQRSVESEVERYDNLARLISALPDLESQSTHLQESVSRARNQKRAPESAGQLADFDAMLAEVRERADALGGLPAPVQQFLQRAVTGQATLADVGPDVWAWLEQRGYLPDVRVSLRRGDGR